jgi:hypothetical protein
MGPARNRRSTVTPTGDTVKKIVIAAAAMGGAALVAFGASGTFAAFSDSSTQSLAAGAGSLRLNIDRPATAPVEAGNLNPGQSVVVPFYVQNIGNNITGKVGVKLTKVVDNENSCSTVSERSAEAAAGGNCDSATDPGEFSKAATYAIAASNADAAGCKANAIVAGSYLPFGLTDGLAPANSPVVLKAGDGQCVLVKITLPGTVGNNVQGDSMSFDALVTLEQSTQPV